ncbi:DJ-1/PfpI family protein [Pleionea sediminis]|uniref:DJ-1/PfpI family protein n=1 Tax=Pleionea sediminis TaxID=2569479 RepID=UPI001186D8F0|nr:DJ-1/PfpI family protein [Pleionea sediminis]
MLKYISNKISYLFVSLALVCASNVDSRAPAKKLLMVISSHGENNGETQPGFEFDELSKAYLTFHNNGVVVDIASPEGGLAEADQYNPDQPFNQAFLADRQAQQKLQNSLKLSTINASNYNAVFVVGGKGAMFDLHDHQPLQAIISDIYQSGGTIGAVCHGPAALVNVKLNNGNYLVAGKAVNAFTNQEEKLFGKKWSEKFEFMLEDKLKQRTARFESSPMMLSHVAIDNRLITGQNPTSTVDVAKAMLETMGIKNPKINRYKDDQTLAIVSKFLRGKSDVINTYRANKSKFQPELLGMYGYYYFLEAKTKKQTADALTLLQVAQEDMKHPQIALQIAKAYQQLGDIKQAKEVITELLREHPDMNSAQELLKQL